jgi:excisionase family DNA binding protein
MTVNEAAEVTGYNPEQIRRLARESKIKSQKWGNTWMINRPSLVEYIETEGRGPKSKRKK